MDKRARRFGGGAVRRARWSFARLGGELTLAPLDALEFQGILPRWWVHFNLLVLRLISFGADLHWRRLETRAAGVRVRHSETKAESRAAYSFFEYFAYCLYPPLYLAGPTCVFHKFAPQLYRAQTTHSRRAVARYALVKFALVFLLLEVWTHLVYTNAMALGRVWTRGATFGPFEVGATSLATLNFMYLKFTVMWRFFRLWALASGVEAPENMLRCVNNNATILGFWKGWHASYNKWLVRYVYVPLGGAKYRLLNAWAVFFFVAAWHDKMNRRLLGWSVIFAAFLAPELLVGAIGRKAFPTAESRDSVVFRCLRSFAGAVNVHVLIAGNMVGYVVGLDGLDELARVLQPRDARRARVPRVVAADVRGGGARRVRTEGGRDEGQGAYPRARGEGGQAKLTGTAARRMLPRVVNFLLAGYELRRICRSRFRVRRPRVGGTKVVPNTVPQHGTFRSLAPPPRTATVRPLTRASR